MQPVFELATSDMIVQFVRRNLGVGCVTVSYTHLDVYKRQVWVYLAHTCFNKRLKNIRMRGLMV